MPRKRKTASEGPATTSTIPEDEQWRIIEQSGILKNFSRDEGLRASLDSTTPAAASASGGNEEEDEDVFSPLGNEIFNAILFIIPFSSLFVTMDILGHRQYGQTPTVSQILETAATGLPLLSLFIFYTLRYKSDRRMQILLLVLSVFSGSRLIYIVNWANWKIVMRQCPPLGTIWIYTVVQLELLYAVVALAVVAAWGWWADMKIVF